MRIMLAIMALLSPAGCSDPGAPAAPEPRVQFQRASADTVAHGKRLADVLGCTGCHGKDLTGEDWSEPGFGRLWTANLTRAMPRYSDEQLEAVIRTGARSDRELWEMPSHLFTHLTADDMAALMTFLRTARPAGEVHPEPAFEAGARREIAAGTLKSSRAQVQAQGSTWPPETGPALGRYIVRATCAECHGMDLRGGTPFAGAKPRPDLRMAAAYDAVQFQRLLRTGKAAGDRELTMMSDVARHRYSRLTDPEIASVHAYLKQVSEVAP